MYIGNCVDREFIYFWKIRINKINSKFVYFFIRKNHLAESLCLNDKENEVKS